MKVTQEKLPASQVGLEIEITPEMSKKAYERVIQEFTRSANIPGFRKGKVPRQVLVQRFGLTRLKATALEELIDSSIKEAIKQENIDALGNFQLRSSFEDLVASFEPGSALTFSASVDVPPETNLKQYTGFQIQAEEVQPDPERVDKVLHSYREQMATLVPVEDRPLQIGDVAIVDFKGFFPAESSDAEPEAIPGAEAQDFQLDMEESRFIPGFVSGIVGMTPGETREVTTQFPPDYVQENLAGREARFTITVKEIKERELPDLDDGFAEEISEFKTLAGLRESLETRYTKEAADQTRANQEQAIVNELLNHIEVEIPATLLEQELNYMINQTAYQLQQQGLDVKKLFTAETIPAVKERSRPEAIERITRSLALGEVAKQEGITVSDEEVKQRIDELLADLEDTRNIDRDRLATVVQEDLLKDKIVDWLIAHSTIEMVPEGTLTQKPEASSDQTEEPEAVVAATATVDVVAEAAISEEAEETAKEPSEA